MPKSVKVVVDLKHDPWNEADDVVQVLLDAGFVPECIKIVREEK